jgi:tetratricopeptide (TPR) repeat protein
VFLQAGSASHPVHHRAGPESPPFGWTYAPAFGIGFGVIVFLVVFVATRRFNAANSVGLRALAEGDFDRAKSEFALLARRFRWFDRGAVVAEYNLALAQLYRGKLGEAITGFGKVEKKVWGLSSANLRPGNAAYLAITYALRGQLDVARTWLAEAERRNANAPFKSVITGFIAFGQAIVELREGRDAEVLGWLEPRWRGLEGSLTGTILRPFTVLRAFATARAGGEREIGSAQRILQVLAPIRPGEFAMLQVEWAEMQRFLH